MLKTLRYSPGTAIMVLAIALSAGTNASASVLAVGPDIFAGSPVLGFTSVRTGTEVNGLVVRGITFNYLLGGIPTNRQLVIDGGPGNTNNITEPNIVSSGDNSGMLTLALPAPVTAIGYGYAILSGDNLPNATAISLFDNSAALGSLSYAATGDPTFAGGFAGIASTIPFNRVVLTFDSVDAPAFAVDNFVFATVPEPSTILLIVTGAGFLLFRTLKIQIAARYNHADSAESLRQLAGEYASSGCRAARFGYDFDVLQ